ncbi:choice-of-anchor L domain-containing protein [Dolichospermum planctonicum CS-1226]|uniref:Choice-of-anchor L domain-containing protein n=1 Tax=Dolichospermum planctonicum CS-1226 TaxID=3021751 RepID=A0ABT5AGL2_9CYAN|nr:choice-of-anchor L domain-containing protein [Dolichospermum planctonicum]MDB9535626.1 choice-of-anchor L domain-containing protein [Dolichospermum planctonicum CS-1226]
MNFSLLIESALKLTYDKISGFSGFNSNFWQVFDSAFGTQYNRSAAEILRLDWQGGNFSQLPQIEVVSNTILGNANGAYSTSTNKIYLSDTFVANANLAAVSDVILEEIGHFVDARINQTDSAGDEGAIFAALVRGESLNRTNLQNLQAENDHATIIINGEAIAIEQSALITRDLNSVTAAQLVNTLIGNSGITPDKISNIRFTGANVAGGTFTGGLGTIGIDNGIVLSTGDIDVDDSAYSTSNGKLGDRDLDAIVKTIVSNNSTYDAAVLEFDFIPTSNTISFSYVFASENYPELGNSRFNDVFAFYLNGRNIAFVPGATTPASINTVNTGTNSAFFKPDYYGNILGTKFDGFTTVLSAVATDLIPGQINHIKLAIADTRDYARDSAVFIQGFSDPSTIVRVIATDSDAGEGTTPNPGVFTITRTGSTNNALTVSYTISGTASTGDYSPIPSTVTFLAGETSKTVTINPVNDNLVEGRETVILSLISGTNYSLGTDNSATVIITDNDVDPRNAVVSLSVNPASVVEDGTTNLVYTFTRAGDLTNALTVNFNVGGSATFSSDSNYTDYTQAGAASFGLTRGSITFAAGASTATLTIDPKADTTFEGNENVELTLAPGSGYVINTATAVIGTITDEDTNVNVAVSADSVLEDGTANLVYTFSRYGNLTNALTVNYSIGGTADGTDYTGATPGTGKTITFNAGETTKQITIDPTADSTVENDETVIFTLASGTGYTVGTSGSATGTINNDDVPLVTLAVTPSSVFEDGTTNLVYTFTRTGVTTNSLTVNYSIGGTADGTDYTGATTGTGTITFAAGETTKQITINPTGNTTVESNETVAVTLANGTGYTVGTTAPVVGTINDDDTASITLTVTPGGVFEDGITNLVYTFTRSYPGGTSLSLFNPLTVNYSIGGTADGADYTGATPGTGKTITFAAGANTATLIIDPTAGTIIEPDETVALTLASGTGYTLGTTGPVVGTINDDDTAGITLTVTPSSVFEDGTTNLVYTFTRSYPGGTSLSLGNPLTVNYSIGGTADGADYTGATPGTGKTITFAAGANTATLIIDPTGDTSVELNETVDVTLANGTGYTVGTTEPVTGTIVDDDNTASITLTVTPSSVFEDGTTNLVYTFTRSYLGGTSLSLGNPLTVNYSIGGTADGTDYTGATPGTGKTITFAAGANTATLIIDPTADAIIESNETVAVTLASGTGYTLGTTGAVVGTINDDDTPSITLTVTPGGVNEDGTTNLVYTFTRSYPGGTSLPLNSPLTNPLTVNFNVNGTATFNTDYTQTGAAITFPTGATTGTGTITFNAGSPTATLTIDPTTDSTFEDNETVIFTLANGTGYTVGTPGPVTGTIINDDTPLVTVAVTPSSVFEDGTTNLVYTFTRTGVTTNPLTVNYSIGGTADGNDYTGATPGARTITFAAGETTKTLTIDPTGDTTVEPDETVIFTLANGTGYTVGTPGSATGTIVNDDTASITLTVTPSSVDEDGTTNLVYTFTRSYPGGTSLSLGNPLTVNFNVGGTATFNTDYTQTGAAITPTGTGTITFLAGSPTATLTIDPTSDNNYEDNETVVVTLANGTGYTLGTPGSATGTINDDNDRPILSSSQFNLIGVEGFNPDAVIVISLIGANGQPVTSKDDITFNYTTSPTGTVSAIPGVDYTNSSGTVIIRASNSEGIIRIPILNDNINEPDKSFLLTLSNPNPTYVTISPSLIDDGIEVVITDTLSSSVTRTLPNLVENLTLTGTSNINGTGNAGNNVITGNSGNNILTGLAGNDTYVFSVANALGVDTIVEAANEGGGIDTIDFSDPKTNIAVPVSINLGITTQQSVTVNNSNLKLTLSAGNVIENAIGGAGNDILTGNTLDNLLQGGSGNDQLSGQNGNDILIGGLGTDNLTGGLGNDTLWGGGNSGSSDISLSDNLDGGQGQDTFWFKRDFSISSSPSLGLSSIRDFVKGEDKIALSKASFNAISVDSGDLSVTDFAQVTDDALATFSNARIVYSTSTGFVFYNSNGSAAGGESRFAKVDPGITLERTDFTVIGTQSSSVDYVLSDLYENFNLTGTGNINGTGNTGNNFITGNSGNNILDGGSGNDTLIGGSGNDTLMGGLGNDQYQFNGVLNTLGVDTINFDAGQISQGQNRDNIALSKATFSAITNAVGQALTDFVVVANDALVGASNARIVYSQGTGSLFYNSNGSNPGGESKFAVLSDPTITLVSSDFTLIA